ncbi:MAG: DUF2892 domain-containing protein [Pseudomonadota bacterium]
MQLANVGTADRLFRLVVGAILIALPFFIPDMALPAVGGIASTAAGAILIVTALIKFCPIYGIFGLRTRPKD